MLKLKSGIFLLTLFGLIVTGGVLYYLGGIDPNQLHLWIAQAGIWAPIIYIALYTVSTLLILPSTALNLTGGAIFGLVLGTLWTSIGAIVAAIASFAFTRTIGRDIIAKKLAGRWQAMDAEMQHGGLFYIFAIRLLPIIPYGIVNYAAGLTNLRFRDYLLGTLLGTIPGILPFVLLGSSGLKALKTGDILPLILALTLSGLLVGVATWYRHRRRPPQND